MNIKNHNVVKLTESDSKIKIIYTMSDIHIGVDNNRETEFYEIFKKTYDMISKDTKDAIICMIGDIIDFKDHPNPESIAIFTDFLIMFSELCPIIMISGNHDACINQPGNMDLINSIYSKLQTKNSLYYLRDSGLYEYGNIIFSVASIFDRKLIPAKEIYNPKKKHLICMHHGFVENNNKKINYEMFGKEYYKINEFANYSAVFLGDIHIHDFIKPNTAYNGSLLQLNHGEELGTINGGKTGHGFIKWTVGKQITGKFIEVPNRYGYLTCIVEDGKIINEPKNYPEITRLRIKYKNTEKSELDKIIADINKKTKTESVNRIKVYDTMASSKIKTTKTDLKINDSNVITNFINDYMKKELKIDDVISKKVIEIHNQEYNKIKKSIYVNKTIKFRKLSFSNLFSYGEGNVLDFDKIKPISCLLGKNAAGKSSILDIIAFSLFDRSIREGTKTKDVENIDKKKYNLELELQIDDCLYKIVKTGDISAKNKMERQTRFYKFDNELNEYIEESGWVNNDITNNIQELLGLSYEDFLYGCLMPQYNPMEILSRGNKERKELISNFLKLDFFEEIHKNISKRVNLLEGELRSITSKILFLENKIEQYNNKEEIKIDRKITLANKKKLENNHKILITKIKNERDKIMFISEKYTVKQKEDELNKIIKNIQQIETKIKELTIEITNSEKGLYDINFDEEKINELESIVTNKVLSKLKQSISKQMFSKVNKILNTTENKKDFNESIIDIFSDKVDIIKEKQLEINNIKEQLNNSERNKTRYNEQIDFVKEQIEIAKNNEKQRKINNDANIKIQELTTQTNELNDKIEELNEKLKTTDDDELFMKKDKEDLSELVKEDKKKKEEKKILEIYQKATSLNGVPNMIFNQVCNEIETSMNILIEQFNLSVKIETNKTKNNIFLDIYKVEKSGKLLDGNRCCGFEQLAINLSFKIALSRLSNISLPSILLLDESISCIDKHNINKLEDIFGFLKDIYDQTIIITHNDKIQEQVDYTITIDRNGQYSKIIN
jgi:DNA repair exonuclease SbcCD ATPase subunit